MYGSIQRADIVYDSGDNISRVCVKFWRDPKGVRFVDIQSEPYNNETTHWNKSELPFHVLQKLVEDLRSL